MLSGSWFWGTTVVLIISKDRNVLGNNQKHLLVTFESCKNALQKDSGLGGEAADSRGGQGNCQLSLNHLTVPGRKEVLKRAGNRKGPQAGRGRPISKAGEM